MQKLAILVAIIATVVMGAAYAATPGNTTITSIANGSLNDGTATAIDTTAGEVQGADISTNQSTFRWAGLYGNVSGNIRLGNDNGDDLYTWTGSGLYVYASTTSSVDWANIGVAVDGDMPAWINVASGASDGFASFTATPGTFASNILPALDPSVLLTFDSADAATWATYALVDSTSGTPLWAGAVNPASTTFDNSTNDFQMVVPEDGTAGDTAATAYYIWVELE